MVKSPPPRAGIFDALSDPTRLGMVEMLMARDRAVSELAAPFEISLPATLKHLKILERAGLTTSEKIGRERYCRFNPAPIDEIRDWADAVRTAWKPKARRARALSG